MTIADFYMVFESNNDVIIGKDTDHGFKVLYNGNLNCCDDKYINSHINRIKEWSGGLIVKI